MRKLLGAFLLRLVQRFSGRLRHPQLFALAVVLFLVDLVVPDLIPMVDELLLLLASLWLASLREPRPPGPPEP